MTNRQETLDALLAYQQPVEQLVLALRSFPWDSEEALALLTREHVASVLMRYLQHELTEAQLEAWADAIEGREDIDFEAGHEELLAETIHQLANPVLTLPLNSETADSLLLTLA